MRDKDLFVDLDGVAIGHAGDEIGHAARGIVVIAGLKLSGQAIGVGHEVGEQRADDVLRPLRVRVFVERSVHAAEEELPQGIGGLSGVGEMSENRAAVGNVRAGDDVGDEGVDASSVRRPEHVSTSRGTSSMAINPARVASSRSWLI